MTEEKRKEVIERLEKMSVETLRAHLLFSIKQKDELLEMWLELDAFDETTKENLFDYAIEMERKHLIQLLLGKGIKPTEKNVAYARSCICKFSKEAEARTKKIYHMIAEAVKS